MARLALLLLLLRLAACAPSSLDVGLCGLQQSLVWTTRRGVPIPHYGWTCSLGLADAPCTWTGVICSGGAVVTLNLYYLGLTGSLSSHIGSLTSLRALRMDVNTLTGSIPSSLGLLTNLEFLGLSTNRMNGTVPSELGLLASLKYALLYNNLFTGALPASVCGLTRLERLYPCDSTGSGCSPGCVPGCVTDLSTEFNYGNLPYCTPGPTRRPTAAPSNSSAPSTIAPTTAIRPSPAPTSRAPTAAPSPFAAIDPALNVNQNLGMCALQTQLRWVYAEGPSKGQSIDHFGWQCLAGVAVEVCGKSGARWSGVACNAANQVVSIQLFKYGVGGRLPVQLGLLTALTSLDLHSNALVGSVPTQIGLLTNLRYLALSDNSFTGAIPAQLGSLSQLLSLYLFGNGFQGAIPATLCGPVSYLTKFFPCNGLNAVACRDLSGCVPRCLLNVSARNFAFLEFCTAAPSARPTRLPSAAPTV